MKKLVFILAVAFGTAVSVNAQENEFAVKGGVNIATLVGDDVEDVDGTIGFHVGALYHLGITDGFAFQPELLLSLKGADGLSLTYIDIPLLAHFHITESFSAHVGPQLSLLVGAEDGADEFIKSLDFGIAAGVTYRLESGLFFTGRYNLGLSSVYEDIETLTVDANGQFTTEEVEFDAKNSVIQVSVGYMF